MINISKIIFPNGKSGSGYFQPFAATGSEVEVHVATEFEDVIKSCMLLLC